MGRKESNHTNKQTKQWTIPSLLYQTRGKNPSEYKRVKQLSISALIKGNKGEDNLQRILTQT